MGARVVKPTLGVILPTRNAVTGATAAGVALADLVDLAVELEGTGCNSVWVGDSLLGRPRPEPIAVLAAIGAKTSRIRLGTSALLPAMRHPLQLAQQLATLDLLSNGRLVVGVGTGYPNDQTRRELDALGIPFGERVSRCHEAVAWCRAAWGSAEPPSPRHWMLDGIRMEPQPLSPQGPPFWLGGASPRTCRIAGTSYDGWMPTSPDVSTFTRGLAIVREAAALAGRDSAAVTASTALTVSIDDDPLKAHEQLREFIETYYNAPLTDVRTVVGCTSGTIREVASHARAFVDAGASHLQIRFAAADQGKAVRRWAAPLLAEITSR